MPIRILNDEQGKTFSPCLLCDKVLEEVSPGSIQKTRQPYAGGEVQFLFSYGSTKLDDNMGLTQFTALVCDDCAEKHVNKMTRLSEDHRETPLPLTKGYMDKLSEMFPLLDDEPPIVTDDMSNKVSDGLSRNNEW